MAFPVVTAFTGSTAFPDAPAKASGSSASISVPSKYLSYSRRNVAPNFSRKSCLPWRREVSQGIQETWFHLVSWILRPGLRLFFPPRPDLGLLYKRARQGLPAMRVLFPISFSCPLGLESKDESCEIVYDSFLVIKRGSGHHAYIISLFFIELVGCPVCPDEIVGAEQLAVFES